MPKTCVLDASVGLRIVLDDEAHHAAARDAYEALLDANWRIATGELYLYETGNVISRSKTRAEKAERLSEAHELAEIVRSTDELLVRALKIALVERVSYYDASYLSLSEMVGGILWTEDREILKRVPGKALDTEGMLRQLGQKA